MMGLFKFLFNKNTLFYNSSEQRQYEFNHQLRKDSISANQIRSF